LEHQATRSGLNGRFVLLGRRTDVGDLLAAADVLLFASRPDGMEGMPAALIEAGMAGLPAAGFAVAGAPEVIEDGRTGLLASPGDEEALAGRVTELLENDERRRALGTAARERCLAHFEIEPISRRYLSLYDEVAGR
jgi:L-malate glycosyltransferase